MTTTSSVFFLLLCSLLVDQGIIFGQSIESSQFAAPDITTAQCVLAVGASDINGDSEVDRFEFNQVILEIMSGCTLHDETIRDWDIIFQQLACLCQEYYDEKDTDNHTASCCTGDHEPVIVRPGRYPNEYTFRMCDLLQEAVVAQCLAYVPSPTMAPLSRIVDTPTSPTTAADTSSSSSSNYRLIINMIILLIIVVILILCITVCYWRWLHLRRILNDDAHVADEEGQTYANTVAKGTFMDNGAGSVILLDIESHRGSQSTDSNRSLFREYKYGDDNTTTPSDIPESIVSSSGDSATQLVDNVNNSNRIPCDSPKDIPLVSASDSPKSNSNTNNNDVSLENEIGWEDFDSGTSSDPQYVGEVDVSADENDGDISSSLDERVMDNCDESTTEDDDDDHHHHHDANIVTNDYVQQP